MSKTCDQCGKGPASGNNVSHSKRRTRRRFMPNLHRLRVLNSGGNFKKFRFCSSCFKTYNKLVLAAY